MEEEGTETGTIWWKGVAARAKALRQDQKRREGTWKGERTGGKW